MPWGKVERNTRNGLYDEGKVKRNDYEKESSKIKKKKIDVNNLEIIAYVENIPRIIIKFERFRSVTNRQDVSDQ